MAGQSGPGGVDLVFLMDTSDGAINSHQGRSPMQTFMYDMTRQLCDSNVALVVYGSNAFDRLNWTSAGWFRCQDARGRDAGARPEVAHRGGAGQVGGGSLGWVG